MRTINIRGQEHDSAHDAIVELNFSGDHAISVAGRYFTVDDAEHLRLQVEEGLQPTTWHHHEATGRIMSVPGNC
jgi:hypothetical protein